MGLKRKIGLLVEEVSEAAARLGEVMLRQSEALLALNRLEGVLNGLVGMARNRASVGRSVTVLLLGEDDHAKPFAQSFSCRIVAGERERGVMHPHVFVKAGAWVVVIGDAVLEGLFIGSNVQTIASCAGTIGLTRDDLIPGMRLSWELRALL